MKKILFGFLLGSVICLFAVPTTFAHAGECIIATDLEGYKFMVLIGKQVFVKEKVLKEMRLNDYKGYVTADSFDNETPTNVTISGNGAIAYVSTVFDENGVNNLYRYENGKRSPVKPIWPLVDTANKRQATSIKINGLATNMDGGKLLVITESKGLVYRGKDGTFRTIRTCAGIPTSIAMSADGNFVFVVTGKNQLNKYTYNPINDTYEYDNKGLWKKNGIILGVSTNMDASKVWLTTCHDYGWGFALMEGSKDGNFRKLYDFDDTSFPWNITLSGNGRMAYVALSGSWICRFAYDAEAKCYVVYKLHY